MGGQQGIAGCVRTQLSVAQNDLRQHGENGFTPRAWEAPDAESAEALSPIMRVASQPTTAVTGRWVGERNPESEAEGQDNLDDCLAIVKELRVGGFIVEIDGDGAVVAFGFGGLCPVSSPSRRWWVRMRHGEVNVLKWYA